MNSFACMAMSLTDEPKNSKIIIIGVVVFFLINSISLIARGIFSKELLGATILPLTLTFVSIIFGSG